MDMDLGENREDLLDYLKLDPDHHEKIASLIPKETWYEELIRYGLYIGAVFQMVCILAVILLPDTEGDTDTDGCLSEDGEDKSRAGSPSQVPQNGGKKAGNRQGKQQKQKRKQL